MALFLVASFVMATRILLDPLWSNRDDFRGKEHADPAHRA